MSDLFNSLSEVSKNLMESVNKKYPVLTADFLKIEAKKLRKVAIKTAKKEVGTSKGKKKNWSKQKSYHSRFKVGKVYNYAENDTCIRVFNSAPHGHLIEYGHRQVARGSKRATTKQGRIEQLKTQKASGYTDGYFIFPDAEYQFTQEFVKDAEEFLAQFIEGALDGKSIAQTYGGNIT